MSQPWKAGFEIELLAPRSQSRANLALRVAWLQGGSVRRFFHPQQEPSKVPGKPKFHNITHGFEALDSLGRPLAWFVDDVTLQAGLDHSAVPLAGWYRIVTDDGRLLRLLISALRPRRAARPRPVAHRRAVRHHRLCASIRHGQSLGRSGRDGRHRSRVARRTRACRRDGRPASATKAPDNGQSRRRGDYPRRRSPVARHNRPTRYRPRPSEGRRLAFARSPSLSWTPRRTSPS